MSSDLIENLVSETTAKRETAAILRRNGFILMAKSDTDTWLKIKNRHSHALNLIAAAGCFYIQFGRLSSGKQDKVVCYTCIVQNKTEGNNFFSFFG